MGKLLLWPLILNCSITCLAQPAANSLPEQVDSLVNSEMQKQQIPGLSIVVLKDGSIMYNKGYGFANLEHQVAVKPETIFQSGSIGKQFTAFALMLVTPNNGF